MRLQFAFLADTAMLGPEGKFYVLGGGLGSLTAQTFPALQPVLGIVARAYVDQADFGQTYPARIDLIQPSGELLLTLAHGSVPIPNRAEGSSDISDESPTVGLVVTFPGVTFPEPGKYIFRVVINEQVLVEVPFLVKSASPSPPVSGDNGGR